MANWKPTPHQLAALDLIRNEGSFLCWWPNFGWTNEAPPARSPLQAHQPIGTPKFLVTNATFDSLENRKYILADRRLANRKKDRFFITDEGRQLLETHLNQMTVSQTHDFRAEHIPDLVATRRWLSRYGLVDQTFPALTVHQISALEVIVHGTRSK